jgi:hypothetical protein
MNDTAVIERVRSFQKTKKPPLVSRMIYTPVQSASHS